MDRMTSDRLVHNQVRPWKRARNERQVNLFDFATSELSRERLVRFIILRDDDATARLLIEAVNNSGPLFAADARQNRAVV